MVKRADAFEPCVWQRKTRVPKSARSFVYLLHQVWNFVPKPDHIADLERRQKALEDEVAKALLHCSTDDPMFLYLKHRILHLRDELEKFRHKAVVNKHLH